MVGSVPTRGDLMTLKNTFGWGQSLTVAKYGAVGALLASTGMVLLSGPISSDPAQTKLECPKFEQKNDPFGEFDDVLTEEEKRQALHEDLKQKLASHKASCDPLMKAPKAPSAVGQEQVKQADSSGSGQASGQQSDGQKATSQQSGDQKPGGQQATTQQTTAQQGSPTPNAPTDGDPEQGTAANGGTYSSPWATQQPGEQSGVVPLEPRVDAKNTKPSTPQPIPAEQTDSQPEPGVSGAAQGPNSTDAAQASGQPSKFLERYGGTGQMPQETIADIANRHKNSGSGSPGNTGTLQQNQKYGAPGSTPPKTATISANDAAIKALEERLESETDPEKKKQIQAEIDRLKK